MAADLIGDLPDITDAIARLRARGEPEPTWLGWLWAQSRATRRDECLAAIDREERDHPCYATDWEYYSGPT